MPAAAATLALATRVTPKARRWRYSEGKIRRCIPDRGGDRHHPRRPFAAMYPLRAFMAASSCHASYWGRVALLSHRFSLLALLAPASPVPPRRTPKDHGDSVPRWARSRERAYGPRALVLGNKPPERIALARRNTFSIRVYPDLRPRLSRYKFKSCLLYTSPSPRD